MESKLTYSIDSKNHPNNQSQKIKHNHDIYLNLIDSFKEHAIPENKKEIYKNYMTKNCSPKFCNEILMFFEDYNSLLSQSIQAIKSLLSEILKLSPKLNESIHFDTSNNNTENNKNKNVPQIFSEDYSTFPNSNISNIKNSLRQNMNNKTNYNKFKSFTPGEIEPILKEEEEKTPFSSKINNIINDYNSKTKKNSENPNFIFNKTFSTGQNMNNGYVPKNRNKKENLLSADMCLRKDSSDLQQRFRKGMSLNNSREKNSNNPFIKKPLRKRILELTDETKAHKEEMNIMQKTNNILKNIDVTEECKEFFIKKYVDKNLKDNPNLDVVNEKYKQFLDNIINYKYPTNILDSIAVDMKHMYKENKINRNKQNKSMILAPGINVKDSGFKNSLRFYYDKNKDKTAKPFNQFTSPYGKLFSKNKA